MSSLATALSISQHQNIFEEICGTKFTAPTTDNEGEIETGAGFVTLKDPLSHRSDIFGGRNAIKERYKFGTWKLDPACQLFPPKSDLLAQFQPLSDSESVFKRVGTRDSHEPTW